MNIPYRRQDLCSHLYKNNHELFLNFRLEAMRNGEETPILDTIVFRKIRILLGGKMRLMLAGGAPLSKGQLISE